MHYLYLITIYPLEWLFKTFYLFSAEILGSYGLAIIALSIFCTLLFKPMKKWTERLSAKEREIQDVLKPLLDNINKNFQAEQRHHKIKKLYRTYSYHPIYGLRALMGIFSQVPFLFGAYYMLLNRPEIRGVSFWIFNDLSKADGLWGGVNALPFLMTGLNIILLLFTPRLTKKEIYQGILIALLFLILLYKESSALLIYWSLNNFFNMMVAIVAFIRKPHLDYPIKHINLKMIRNPYVQQIMLLVAGNIIIFSVLQKWALGYSKGKMDKFLGLIILYGILKYLLYKKQWKKSWLTYPIAILILITIGIYSKSTVNYAVLCLGIIFGLINLLFYKQVEIKNGFQLFISKDYWNGPVLYLGAILLFHISNNLNVVNFPSIVLLIGVILFISSYVYWCNLSFVNEKLTTDEVSFITGISFILLGGYPIIVGLLTLYAPPSYIYVTYFILGFVLLYFSFFQHKKMLQVVLLISALGIGSMQIIKSSDDGTKNDSILKLSKDMEQLKFSDSASVFLIVFDAVPSLELFPKLGLDSSKLLALLHEHNFKIYPKTYSWGRGSRTSMSATHNMSEAVPSPIDMQKSLAGEGRVWKVFKQNHYKTINIQHVYMTSFFNAVDKMLPPRVSATVKLDGMELLLLGICVGEFRFDLHLPLGDLSMQGTIIEYLQKVLSHRQERTFLASHMNGPGHSQNSGHCMPNESQLFANRLDAALKYMRKYINLIEKHNPQAVVVFMSDHGAYLKGDCKNLDDYPPEEVTELLMRDRFGTMVAIRWPDPKKAQQYDQDLLLNQDVFPIVFAYLSDSKVPLRWKPKRVVPFKGHYLDNGIFK